MASVHTGADLDTARAAFDTAVNAVLASVTALANVTIPEMTFVGANANATALQMANSSYQQIVTVLSGFSGRAAQACSLLRPLLPPS